MLQALFCLSLLASVFPIFKIGIHFSRVLMLTIPSFCLDL